MKLYHSASAGANNSPCQPFSASVVNIDPASASSHYLTMLPVTRDAVFKKFP